MKVLPAVLQLCTDHFHLYVKYLLDAYSVCSVGERIVFFWLSSGFGGGVLSVLALFLEIKLCRVLKHAFKHVITLFATKRVLYKAHCMNRLLPAGRELVMTVGQVGTLSTWAQSPCTQAGWQSWSADSTHHGMQSGPWCW